jgi:hypothetical protein
MKQLFLLSTLIMFTLLGCGVSTDSSGVATNFVPDDGNTTNPDDGNTTNPDDGNTTDPDDGNTTDPTDPIFDTVDATLDDNACRSSYATAIPLQDHNSNDDREVNDLTNGISIQSLYNDTTGVSEDTNVIVFYKVLPAGTTLGPVDYRVNLYGDNANFLLTYDKAWIDVPENTVYIQTPKDGNSLPSCFRATLNSATSSSVNLQKVYR